MPCGVLGIQEGPETDMDYTRLGELGVYWGRQVLIRK